MAGSVFSQDTLSLNEHGRLILYEIVTADKISKEKLYERSDLFLHHYKKFKVIKEGSTDSSLLARGKFVLTKNSFVLSHPSGEVLFKLSVEVKEGRYRFWLTDFSYIPYVRDRYGNFVPSTAKGAPLEQRPAGYSEANWNDNLMGTAKQARVLANDLKKALAEDVQQPAKKAAAVTVSTNNW